MASDPAVRKLAIGLFSLMVLGGSINLVKTGSVTGEQSPDYSAATAASVSAPPAQPLPFQAAVPTMPVSGPAGEGRAVARVIDGDTFELVSGERVRVLGIDSCEMSTDRGPDAKQAAELWLAGGQVTLTAEPGVDRDRYGRLLRYVEASGGDLGEMMVSYGHTGVYEGRNDASAARLAQLRSADVDGRTCDEPEPYVAPLPDPDPDVSSRYVPTPSDDESDDEDYSAPKRRTGNSGHPCLPGERDGDNDGYCGEGR